jgi:ribosomal protein L29
MTVATKKQKEIGSFSKEELSEKLKSAQSDLFKAQMQHTLGTLENTASLWKMRKNLARIKTYLSQKGA